MRTLAWRTASAGFAVGLFALAFGGPALSQQVVPDDETPIIDMTPPDPDRPEATGSFQDKPTSVCNGSARLGAWSPRLPRNELKEGKSTPRRRTRAAEVGQHRPDRRRYEQNGSFTGHVRDSGRARTILPHPRTPTSSTS